MTPQPDEITQLLVAWSDGEQAALDKLMPLVYNELRRIARFHMKHQPQGHTLQTTAIINEAYIKMVGQPGKRWQSRTHFFAVAARAMRHVLVDHARAQQCSKRGGKNRKVSLDEAIAAPNMQTSADLIALDDALRDLKAKDLRKSQIVEMRYFGGMTVEETAEALGISVGTVIRDWNAARAWLLEAINNKRQR